MKKLIFSFVLLQFYFITNILSFAIWEVGGVAAIHLIIYFGIWIAILAAILWTYFYIVDTKKRPRLTLAIIAVMTLPMFGIWIQSLELDPRWVEWIFLLIFPFGVFIYIRLGNSNFGKTTTIILGLCALSIFSHSGLSQSIFTSKESETKWDSHSQLKLIHKPNIHMVMFDSLTTSNFTREFLELDNPASDFFSENYDILFAGDRGFVEDVPTRRSWNVVFNLGTRKTSRKGTYMFSGIDPSPLSELLNYNNYSIQTGYSSMFFGWRKGDHIDYYLVGNNRWEEVRRPFCVQNLLGYCSDLSGKIYDLLASLYYGQNRLNLDSDSWEHEVVELIRHSEISVNSPIFSAFHIYLPGHTPIDFVASEESVQEFRHEFELRLFQVLDVLHEFKKLAQEYPESIFIISGDHGPWVSRNISYEENRRFFVLDRHHVALAMIGERNLCEYERTWLSQQDYLSPAKMLVAALSCNSEPNLLLDGASKLKNPDFVEFGATLGR